jgi:hypothetical protein
MAGNRDFPLYLLAQTLSASDCLFIANSGQKCNESLISVAYENIGFSELGFNAIGNTAEQGITQIASINTMDLS